MNPYSPRSSSAFLLSSIILHAVACGFFGAMTSLRTLVAFLNQRNPKIAVPTGFVGLLLAFVTLSFLLNH
ncbi:MAG: hypothetical protein Fur0032_23640 [Terrimicrobiaceae bacterium]